MYKADTTTQRELIRAGYQFLEQCWQTWNQTGNVDPSWLDTIAVQQQELLPYQPHHDLFANLRDRLFGRTLQGLLK